MCHEPRLGALSVRVSILNNDTAMPMATVMCACAIASFIVLLTGPKIIEKAKAKLVAPEENCVKL